MMRHAISYKARGSGICPLAVRFIVFLPCPLAQNTAFCSQILKIWPKITVSMGSNPFSAVEICGGTDYNPRSQFFGEFINQRIRDSV